MFLPAWVSKRQCNFSAFCAAEYHSRCAPDAQRKVLLLLLDEHMSNSYRSIVWYWPDAFAIALSNMLSILWTHIMYSMWLQIPLYVLREHASAERYSLRKRKNFNGFTLVKWNDTHLWFIQQIRRSYDHIRFNAFFAVQLVFPDDKFIMRCCCCCFCCCCCCCCLDCISLYWLIFRGATNLISLDLTGHHLHTIHYLKLCIPRPIQSWWYEHVHLKYIASYDALIMSLSHGYGMSKRLRQNAIMGCVILIAS